MMQSSQHGSHVEYEVLTVVSASSPEEATSKAERKRILGTSYSSQKTLEGTYCILHGRLREDERKCFNYFRMSTSTFDYIVTSLVAWWSELLTTNHEVPGSIPGSTMCVFP